MFKHLDKHRNEVAFMKCEDELCCPEFRSTKLKIYFQKTNVRFPAPTPSSSIEGHSKSFLEEYENDDNTFVNEGQRSAVTDDFFLKDKESSSYYFTLPSKGENSKHYRTG